MIKSRLSTELGSSDELLRIYMRSIDGMINERIYLPMIMNELVDRFCFSKFPFQSIELLKMRQSLPITSNDKGVWWGNDGMVVYRITMRQNDTSITRRENSLTRRQMKVKFKYDEYEFIGFCFLVFNNIFSTKSIDSMIEKENNREKLLANVHDIVIIRER
jgi:hypothetical protein